jgi:hypothetical protein
MMTAKVPLGVMIGGAFEITKGQVMGFFRTLVAVGACAAIATPALAAGKIYYGSRAGMMVTVVSIARTALGYVA